MKYPVLRRGTYANVASTLALVLAVGGTSAYAATVITTKQIKNGTIRAVDLHAGAVNNSRIATNAVTGAKVYDRSLTKADLAPGTIPAPYAGVKAYTAALGNGVAFDDTPDGITGVYAPAGTYLASAVTTIYNNDPVNEATVTCVLSGPGGSDTKSVYVEKSAANSPNRMALSFQLAGTLAAPGQIRLDCGQVGASNVEAHNSRVSAVKVDSLQVAD